MRNQHHGGGIIFLTFIIALILTVMPMPGWAVTLRPEWMLLTLVYWCLALPNRIGVGTAWTVGLLMDVILGAVLGQHALSLSIIAYLTLKLHQRVRVFPLWQQALFIMVLTALHQMLILWTTSMTDVTSHAISYWLPSISSTIIWPVVFLILRNVRRHFFVT